MLVHSLKLSVVRKFHGQNFLTTVVLTLAMAWSGFLLSDHGVVRVSGS